MSLNEVQSPIEESSEMLTKTQQVTFEPAITATVDDYRFSFQLWVEHLLHRNEEGIQINMENAECHGTVYKLAYRADKANFSSLSAFYCCEAGLLVTSGDKFFHPSLKHPSLQKNPSLAFEAFKADVGAHPYYFPFIAAAGVRLA